MHKFSMPEEIIARVVARVGRTHPFDKLEASKTPFVVIDHAKLYLKSTCVTCHWWLSVMGMAQPLISGQDAPSRYRVGGVAGRSALPRERFSPLAPNGHA
jgi:hypothetical protein